MDLLKKTKAWEVLNRADGLDIDYIAQQIYYNSDVQEYIIGLNTDGQLFSRGVNALGRALAEIGGAYSPRTILDKREKGLPTDRITLFDTGDFYKSWVFRVLDNGFELDADFVKDNEDLRDRWGENITGLDEDSREELILLLIQEAKTPILQWILLRD